MADFGGLMRVMVDGSPIKLRGTFKLKPTNFAYTIENNQDGSKDRMLAPDGPSADVDLVDSLNGTASSQPWDAIMAKSGIQVNIMEDNTGVIHQFSNAFFTGKPDIDRLKGSVTGIQVHCANGAYKQLTA